MEKVIKITDPKVVAKITKVLEEKARIHKLMREGKLSEIGSSVKLVKPL